MYTKYTYTVFFVFCFCFWCMHMLCLTSGGFYYAYCFMASSFQWTGGLRDLSTSAHRSVNDIWERERKICVRHDCLENAIPYHSHASNIPWHSSAKIPSREFFCFQTGWWLCPSTWVIRIYKPHNPFLVCCKIGWASREILGRFGGHRGGRMCYCGSA